MSQGSRAGGPGVAASGPDRSKSFRLGLALWVALIATAAVKPLLLPAKHSVYPVISAAARRWSQGGPIYGRLFGLPDTFRYSPTQAVAVLPLAALGDRWGGMLWGLLNLGVMLAGVLVAARDLFPGRWPRSRVGLLLLLTLTGTFRSAWNAQGNPLLIGTLLLGASAVVRRRWWAAAAILAVPVFMKIWPLAVVLLLVAWRPGPLLGRMAVALAAGAAIPFATRPASYVLAQYRGWAASLIHSTRTRWPAFRDARTLWEATGQPFHPSAYRGLQVGFGLLVAALCLGLRRRRLDERTALCLALTLALANLLTFGPSVEYPTFTVLAPLASWAVLHSFERRRGRALALAAFTLTMIAGSDPVERALAGVSPLARCALPVGSLLLAAWAVATGFRGGPAPGSSDPVPPSGSASLTGPHITIRVRAGARRPGPPEGE